MRYYTKCEHLPLRVFFEVVNTGDLSHLYVGKKQKTDNIEDVWDDLQDEFGRLSTESSYSNYLDKANKVNQLKNTYMHIKFMLGHMELRFEYDWYVLLMQMGYYIEVQKTREEYLQSLQVVGSQCEGLVTEIAIIMGEMNNNSEDGKELNFEDVYAWLLMNSNGAAIERDIPVSQYISMKRAILKMHKSMKKNG